MLLFLHHLEYVANPYTIANYVYTSLNGENRKGVLSGVMLGFYFRTGSRSSNLNEIFLMCCK
jgi:hypothetical protein